MNELTDEQILAAMTQEHHGRITLVNVNGKPAPTTVARTFVDRIIAAHEAAKPGWQPIESAPKNMEDIDIWCRLGRIPNCCWNQTTYGKKIGFIYQSDYDYNGPVFELAPEPTHWMPLPKAPD